MNLKRLRWLLLAVVQPPSISARGARGWSQNQSSDELARRGERDNIGSGRPRSDLSLEPLQAKAVSFGTVRRVAILNVFVNALRPDPTIIWQVSLAFLDIAESRVVPGLQSIRSPGRQTDTLVCALFSSYSLTKPLR